MTRFAGRPDISEFIQRNQYADKIGAAGMNAYADQTSAGFRQDAAVENAGIMGEARVEAAKHRASAIKAGGQAAGQQSMMSGIFGGIGSLAGSMFSGGSSFGSDPVGSQGNPLGLGGRFREGGY